MRNRFKRLAALTAFALWTGAAPAAPPAAAEPAVVKPDYFGLVLNRKDAAAPWPNLRFGSWRLWDAYVTWADLEPKPGQWDFSLLDRYVEEASQHRVKLMLVLAHTPRWASARPDEQNAFRRPGVAAEPARIEDWQRYVRTVVERYKSRIESYQIWNEPSDKAHFTGTLEQLVEMACTAHRIIRSFDPAAKVVSPPSAGGGKNIEYLDRFLRGGGKACIDVAAHHFYVPRYGPEAMAPMIRGVKQVLRDNGLANMPLWSTENGWWIESSAVGSGEPKGWRKVDVGSDLAATIRSALYIARSEGVDRFYWYAWSNRTWGLADADGKAKPGADEWDKVAAEMIDGEVAPCTLTASTTSCRVLRGKAAAFERSWSTGDALTPREGPAAGRR